jgi:hypothetical protein
MHVEAARAFGNVAAAQFINPLDVFPTGRDRPTSDSPAAFQACLPDAEVKIDSEASPDILAEYQVNDGDISSSLSAGC